MVGTVRAFPSSDIGSVAMAVAVGVSSLMDLTGRTTATYFRCLRSEGIAVSRRVELTRAVKRGQWAGFIVAMVVLASAFLSLYAGHPSMTVALVATKTTVFVVCATVVGRCLRARQP